MNFRIFRWTKGWSEYMVLMRSTNRIVAVPGKSSVRFSLFEKAPEGRGTAGSADPELWADRIAKTTIFYA